MSSDSTTAPRNTPQFVEPDMDNGCETGACELAKLFYNTNERVIRRLRFRRELSDFYIATFKSWAPSGVINNPALHRTFSQVLFALVNDGKVLRISNSRLLWLNNGPPRSHSQRRHTHHHNRRHTHHHNRRHTHTAHHSRHPPRHFPCHPSEDLDGAGDPPPSCSPGYFADQGASLPSEECMKVYENHDDGCWHT